VLPNTSATSSAIWSASEKERIRVPSAKWAEYEGSRRCRFSQSDDVSPTLARLSSIRAGRVSTVGPVSNR
jgi:hypothetical protein